MRWHKVMRGPDEKRLPFNLYDLLDTEGKEALHEVWKTLKHHESSDDTQETLDSYWKGTRLENASALVAKAVWSCIRDYGWGKERVPNKTDSTRAAETPDTEEFSLLDFKTKYKKRLGPTTNVKELCIVISYFKDDQHDMEKLAKMLTDVKVIADPPQARLEICRVEMPLPSLVLKHPHHCAFNRQVRLSKWATRWVKSPEYQVKPANKKDVNA